MKDMLALSLQDIIGPIKDLLDKLAGPQAKQWFIAFKRFLRKEDPWVAEYLFSDKIDTVNEYVLSQEDRQKVLTVFRDAICPRLVDEVLESIRWGDSLLEILQPSNQKICCLSVAELGFENGATIFQIFKKAKSIRLGFCTMNLILFLILRGQILKQRTLISLNKPFAGSNTFELLPLGDGESVAVRMQSMNPDCYWGPSAVFAFTINSED